MKTHHLTLILLLFAINVFAQNTSIDDLRFIEVTGSAEMEVEPDEIRFQIGITEYWKDEFEKGDRRLLNFGHTLGHALETQYELLHGQAVSIGMTYACHISEQLCGFRQTEKVVSLLTKYNLPTYATFDKQKVFNVLKMDKKRERKDMNYVLLERIGKGVVKSISLKQLEKIIGEF